MVIRIRVGGQPTRRSSTICRSTEVTSRGVSSSTSSHWPIGPVNDDECHAVRGSPSIAANGWCPGSDPPKASANDAAVDAVTARMPR